MIGSYEFKVQSTKNDIDFINKIIEAYDGYGVVRTIDPNSGLINIIVTNDYIDEIRNIINDLDARFVTAKIICEEPWCGKLY